MEKKREVLETNAGMAGVNTGRRRAMRKIAVGVGALAGLSVLPEQWTRPIIGRIVVPAHAQTSGEIPEPAPEPQPQGCGLGAGCYLIGGTGPLSGDYFSWPGGAGPYLAPGSGVPFHSSSECSDSEFSTYSMVLASSEAEAQTALGGGSVIQLDVSAAPAGCSFYVYAT